FYGIQTLMARSMVESGECLLHMINRPSSFGLQVPLQLRVLECDHLDGTADRDLPGGWFHPAGANAMTIDVATLSFSIDSSAAVEATKNLDALTAAAERASVAVATLNRGNVSLKGGQGGEDPNGGLAREEREAEDYDAEGDGEGEEDGTGGSKGKGRTPYSAEVAKRSVNTIVSYSTKAFETLHTKQIADWDKAWEQMQAGAVKAISNIEAEILVKIPMMLLLDSLTGGGGGFLSGLLGGGGASSKGGFGLFHAGGVVGEGGATRNADPGWWAGAQRYHDGGTVGLEADEVPIIAQKGERVLTAEQQRNLGISGGESGGSAGITINQTFHAAGASQMDRVAMANWARQIKAETMAAVVDAKQRGGRYGKAFE
ncbi:MAG: hypothetical protein ABT940_12925, partial [Alphaproteobacteria bacterium]